MTSAAVIRLSLGMALVGCAIRKPQKVVVLPPTILNINSETDPSSALGAPIEIHGKAFGSAPGQVVFTEGSTVATVTPEAAGWMNTGIVVPVPRAMGLASPGTVTVTVKTRVGTSNEVSFSLVDTPTFNLNNVTWTATTDLPVPLTGLGAAAVFVNSASAYLVVAGGFDGSVNTSNVYSNVLAADGTVGPSWTTISNMPLPDSRAHFGMVEADPSNSLVPGNSRFVYVIGGQELSTDTPGGTSTVYAASVDITTGAVGLWTKLASALPAPVVGPAVAIFNGSIYVVGGLHTDGTPSSNVYSAQVNTDGTLSAWATSANAYPAAIAFAPAFGFAGNLYVLGGDTATSTDPINQGGDTGTNAVNYASASGGSVGPWIATSTLLRKRKKQVAWSAFGQILDAEGIYTGIPGTLEIEMSAVNADGTLAAWTGILGVANQINANVYNAASVVSPLPPLTSKSSPRFLLLGGQAFTLIPPGALSKKVYYNNAP